MEQESMDAVPIPRRDGGPSVSLESHLYKIPAMDMFTLKDMVKKYIEQYDVFSSSWKSGVEVKNNQPEVSLMNLPSNQTNKPSLDPSEAVRPPIFPLPGPDPTGPPPPPPEEGAVGPPIEPAEENMEEEEEPQQPQVPLPVPGTGTDIMPGVVPGMPMPSGIPDQGVPEALAMKRPIEEEDEGPNKKFPEIRLFPENTGLFRERNQEPVVFKTQPDFNNILDELSNEQQQKIDEYIQEANAFQDKHDMQIENAQRQVLEYFDRELQTDPAGIIKNWGSYKYVLEANQDIFTKNKRLAETVVQATIHSIEALKSFKKALEIEVVPKQINALAANSTQGNVTVMDTAPANGPDIPLIYDNSVEVTSKGQEIEAREPTMMECYKDQLYGIKCAKYGRDLQILDKLISKANMLFGRISLTQSKYDAAVNANNTRLGGIMMEQGRPNHNKEDIISTLIKKQKTEPKTNYVKEYLIDKYRMHDYSNRIINPIGNLALHANAQYGPSHYLVDAGNFIYNNFDLIPKPFTLEEILEWTVYNEELKAYMTNFITSFVGAEQNYSSTMSDSLKLMAFNVEDQNIIEQNLTYFLPTASFTPNGSTTIPAVKIKLAGLTSPMVDQVRKAIQEKNRILNTSSCVELFEDYIKNLQSGKLLSQSVDERKARSDLYNKGQELINEAKLSPHTFNDWQTNIFNTDGANAFVLNLNNRVQLNRMKEAMHPERFSSLVSNLNKYKDWNHPLVIEHVPDDYLQLIKHESGHTIVDPIVEGENRLDKPAAVRGRQYQVISPWYAKVNPPSLHYCRPDNVTSEFSLIYETLKEIISRDKINLREEIIQQLDEFTPKKRIPLELEFKQRFEDEYFDHDDMNYYSEQFKSVFKNVAGLLHKNYEPIGLLDFISGRSLDEKPEPEFSDANHELLKQVSYAHYLFNKLSGIVPVTLAKPQTSQSPANSRAIFVSSLVRNAFGVNGFNDEDAHRYFKSAFPSDNCEALTVVGKYQPNSCTSLMGSYLLNPQNPMEQLLHEQQVSGADIENLFKFISTRVMPQIEQLDYSNDIDKFEKYRAYREVFFQNSRPSSQNEGFFTIGGIRRAIYASDPEFKYCEILIDWFRNDIPLYKNQVEDMLAANWNGDESIKEILSSIWDQFKKRQIETLHILDMPIEVIARLKSHFTLHHGNFQNYDDTMNDYNEYIKAVRAPNEIQPVMTETGMDYSTPLDRYRRKVGESKGFRKTVGAITGLAAGMLINQFKGPANPYSAAKVFGEGRHRPEDHHRVKQILQLLKTNKQPERKACGVCKKITDKMWRPEIAKNDEDDLCQSCFDSKELSANGINPEHYTFKDYDNTVKNPETVRKTEDYDDKEFVKDLNSNHLDIEKWNPKWFHLLIDGLIYNESHSVSSTFKANLIKLIHNYLKTIPRIKPSNKAITTDMFQSRDHLIRTIENEPGILANYHP